MGNVILPFVLQKAQSLELAILRIWFILDFKWV